MVFLKALSPHMCESKVWGAWSEKYKTAVVVRALVCVFEVGWKGGLSSAMNDRVMFLVTCSSSWWVWLSFALRLVRLEGPRQEP